MINTRKIAFQGVRIKKEHYKNAIHAFSHPDYTVGTGITPVQLARADFTAGRELHPALKTYGGSIALPC